MIDLSPIWQALQAVAEVQRPGFEFIGCGQGNDNFIFVVGSCPLRVCLLPGDQPPEELPGIVYLRQYKNDPRFFLPQTDSRSRVFVSLGLFWQEGIVLLRSEGVVIALEPGSENDTGLRTVAKAGIHTLTYSEFYIAPQDREYGSGAFRTEECPIDSSTLRHPAEHFLLGAMKLLISEIGDENAVAELRVFPTD